MFNKIIMIQLFISSIICVFVGWCFPAFLISNNFFRNICVPAESLYAAYIASRQTGDLFHLSLTSFLILVIVLHSLLMVRRNVSFKPNTKRFLEDLDYQRGLIFFYLFVIILSIYSF